jgi:hypothetical protein
MNRHLYGLPRPALGLLLLLATLAWSDSLAALAASPPGVTFSASPTVECRDVTPAEFARANPQEKLIEATFRVSALVTGPEDALDEVLVVVTSPERRLRVADFWPQTESTTDIVGPIERVTTNETSRSLQAGVGGSLGAKYGPASAQVSPSASAGQSESEGVKESYKKLPPKRLLLASGTTEGEHGAFFKLKPSSQVSLQGSRQFGCLFVVPAAWRGDWLSLACSAKAQTRRQFVRRIEECGQATLTIGLYLEGDGEAKRLAQQLDLAQSRSLLPPSNNSGRAEEPPPASLVAAQDATRSVSAAAGGLPSLWHVCRKVLWIEDEVSTGPVAATLRSPVARPTPSEARRALARLSGHAAQLDEPPQLP